MPEPIVMKFGVYIMPPEDIKTEYFVSISNTNTPASPIVESVTLYHLNA
jgi:hypothetical protein